MRVAEPESDEFNRTKSLNQHDLGNNNNLLLTSYRYKDYNDSENVNQLSYVMGPTENYSPQKGIFKKSTSKTESNFNESLSAM